VGFSIEFEFGVEEVIEAFGGVEGEVIVFEGCGAAIGPVEEVHDFFQCGSFDFDSVETAEKYWVPRFGRGGDAGPRIRNGLLHGFFMCKE